MDEQSKEAQRKIDQDVIDNPPTKGGFASIGNVRIGGCDTPPMPKVKDPKPEGKRSQCPCDPARDCLMQESCNKCMVYATWLTTTPSPIPRKEVISIQPGDVIVLSCRKKLNKEEYLAMGADLVRAFPDNRGTILDDGMTLEVYREQGRYVDVTGLDGVKTIKDTHNE